MSISELSPPSPSNNTRRSSVNSIKRVGNTQQEPHGLQRPRPSFCTVEKYEKKTPVFGPSSDGILEAAESETGIEATCSPPKNSCLYSAKMNFSLGAKKAYFFRAFFSSSFSGRLTKSMVPPNSMFQASTISKPAPYPIYVHWLHVVVVTFERDVVYCQLIQRGDKCVKLPGGGWWNCLRMWTHPRHCSCFRNPANQLRLSVCPCLSRELIGFIRPKWWSPDFWTINSVSTSLWMLQPHILRGEKEDIIYHNPIA